MPRPLQFHTGASEKRLVFSMHDCKIQGEITSQGVVSVQSTALLRSILDNTSQGILVIDERGEMVLVNSRVVELFQYPADELIGRSVEMLLPESSRQTHAVEREGFFREPHARPMGLGVDLAGRRKDGEEIPVEISLSYVETEHGLLGVAFISDISARRQAQERLLHSQKMESVGQLAGGVAHDFNNLLTIISGFNRMLLDRLSTFDPLRGYAEEIQKASERAGALVQQLLSFSRRQSNRAEPLALNEVINQMSRMLGRVLGADIDLQLNLERSLPRIRGDRSQIEQLILNLVLNARDAMPSGGRLSVEASSVELSEDYVRTHLGVEPGRYVILAVSDTGVGMDADTRRRIFDPLFTTKSDDKNSGLGLWMVYGIVKQSRGDVWVYSEPGQGSIFKVYLPVLEDPAAEEGEEPRAPAQTTGGSETVLVAEDEDGVRQLVASMLRGHGYTVHEASDGAEALRLAEGLEGELDLLLTDVVLPQRSGADVAAALRESRPHIKTLFISGYTERMMHDRRPDALPDDANFLNKPFSFEDLLGAVRAALDE